MMEITDLKVREIQLSLFEREQRRMDADDHLYMTSGYVNGEKYVSESTVTDQFVRYSLVPITELLEREFRQQVSGLLETQC